jgi:hypothetical protein
MSIHNIAAASGLRPFYRPITNPVKKRLGAEAIYHYRAEAIYLEMYREALFKPGKRVYIGKRYPNPIPIFTLPIFKVVIVVIVVASFLGLLVVFRGIS